MATELAKILEELRKDHRNMEILLDILEQEVLRIRSDEEPDYNLLTDIMRYMTVYTDTVHHPREDLIYDRMRIESPQLAADLEPIEEDHRQIAELSEKLRADVEDAVSGAAIRLEQVTDDMSEYVERLRSHMAWEDRALFVKADELIKNTDTLIVYDAHLQANDPVFGMAPEKSFAKLQKEIQALTDYQ